MFSAVQFNHIGAVDFLIKKGANVNFTDNELNTPLIEAARQKNLDIKGFSRFWRRH